MSVRLGILCSGQGAQHPAMFELASSDARVKGLLTHWRVPPLQGGADLFANRVAQPMIVAASCALWEAVRTRLPVPQLVAGYSVGELAALSVAGMLGAPAAIALARERARLMDACIDPAVPQGLLAVSGLATERLAPLLQRSRLYLAIDNGADQCIVGGTTVSLAALQAGVANAGGRTQLLKVGIASHTPLMADAVAPLIRTMEQLTLLPPTIRILSGHSAQPVIDAEAAMTSLAAQLVQPVHWAGCMDAMAEAGITTALELGPGNALARMLADRHPQIACRSAADFRTLDGLASWVERALGQ